MVKENNSQELQKTHGIDDLAIETANELADEALHRFGSIMTTSLSDEEKEIEIETLLQELNSRGNEMYRHKLQKGIEDPPKR